MYATLLQGKGNLNKEAEEFFKTLFDRQKKLAHPLATARWPTLKKGEVPPN